MLTESKKKIVTLLTSGVAAILASTCCLGPLILIALGFSGAWIGNLTILEPFRPVFIVIALVSMFFAWKQIFRSPSTCKPKEVCVRPQVKNTYKIIFWLVVLLMLVTLSFPYILPFFY